MAREAGNPKLESSLLLKTISSPYPPSFEGGVGGVWSGQNRRLDSIFVKSNGPLATDLLLLSSEGCVSSS